MSTLVALSTLRALAARSVPPLPGEQTDYRIAARLGAAFLARDKRGSLALLVPMPTAGGSVGRSGGGFTLRAAPGVEFNHDGRSWRQPAAILECTDSSVVDTFLALAADLSNRLASDIGSINWPQILLWMEEWQALLSRRAVLSPEAQLGLWGELLLILLAEDADALFTAWRGPDEDTVDFFVNGVALEVKTSRHQCVHHVSQSQVTKPRGDFPSHFLSLWASTEPVRGVSLVEVVDRLTNRLRDSAAFLKYIARTGYSPRDREEYLTRFLLLGTPRWFNAEDIPRVRAADPGISQLRYLAALDMDLTESDDEARRLWRHFCGREQPPGDLRAALT